MLLGIFNLLLRWLIFIAVIWPVRAGSTALQPSSFAKSVYWQASSFSVILPKDINKKVCNTSFVTQYFKIEKNLMNFSLSYVDHHIDNVKSFYKQIDLDLQKQNIDKNQWNANKVGLNHLAQYAESLYEISDNLNIFFNQLEICWKKRNTEFIALKTVVNNYRTQDILLAEVMFYFSDQLQQVFSLLEEKDLSTQNKKQILDKGKEILKTSKKLQVMLSFNYAILAKDLEYIAQLYWGI